MTQHVTKANIDAMLGTPIGCNWPRWRKRHLTQAMRMDDPWTEQDCGYGSPCWVWSGSRFLSGYGQASKRNGTRIAHRVVYEQLRGPIPEGLQIDHLCRNPPCVNPDHLEPVTPRENQMRSTSMSAIHAAKTHCPLGHPYDDDNTAITVAGTRRCRQCGHERSRRNVADPEMLTDPQWDLFQKFSDASMEVATGTLKTAGRLAVKGLVVIDGTNGRRTARLTHLGRIAQRDWRWERYGGKRMRRVS